MQDKQVSNQFQEGKKDLQYDLQYHRENLNLINYHSHPICPVWLDCKPNKRNKSWQSKFVLSNYLHKTRDALHRQILD